MTITIINNNVYGGVNLEFIFYPLENCPPACQCFSVGVSCPEECQSVNMVQIDPNNSSCMCALGDLPLSHCNSLTQCANAPSNYCSDNTFITTQLPNSPLTITLAYPISGFQVTCYDGNASTVIVSPNDGTSQSATIINRTSTKTLGTVTTVGFNSTTASFTVTLTATQ